MQKGTQMTDEQYMRRAIELAKRGMGYTSPNPMVGAVIVKDGRIIGEGWHERYGELHAERNALKHCKESPQGADMYVTLEPCCHHGKQPPCVEAVIEAGIKRVYVGSDDPNPLVAGGGIKILKEHGIEVVTQVLKDECDRLNEVFFYFIQTRRPYVAMKYAMTMDGKIATYSGLSKWITGEKAREHVQNLRHRYKAIMAGIGTVLADDPLLTCRIEGGVNPIRIICDTHLKPPPESQIVNTAKEVPTIVAVSERYQSLLSHIRGLGESPVQCVYTKTGGKQYGNRIYQMWRLLHSRSDLAGGAATHGEVGADAPGIPEGNVSHHLHQSDSVWEALDLSCGPERTGAAAAGHAGVPDEGCRRNHRSTESQRPDAMGAADEQHPGQGGGNSP